jgi:hypothetical protein
VFPLASELEFSDEPNYFTKILQGSICMLSSGLSKDREIRYCFLMLNKRVNYFTCVPVFEPSILPIQSGRIQG